MNLKQPVPVLEISNYIGAQHFGNQNLMVSGLNEIHKIQDGDLTFVDYHKYFDRALHSKATVIIINSTEVEIPAGKAILLSEDPFRDYNKLVKKYYTHSISASSDLIIGENSTIDEGTIISHRVTIGSDVFIGKNCRIHPNVVIYDNAVIGDNVIIHANTVIGADAFYFKKRPTGYDKLLSCGRVVIENDVEVGAGCTIDKGVSGDTVIGEGTKIDNHVHVGHGTIIGKNCLFAAQVGIGGKVIIEDDVTLWGQVGVQKDLLIERGAVVLGQSGVSKSLKGAKVYFGSPAADAKTRYREFTYLKKLPAIIDKHFPENSRD